MSHAHIDPASMSKYKEYLKLHTSHKIVMSRVTEDFVEIIRQYPSNARQSNGDLFPDRVVKEIYVVRDGKIVLDREVEGTHKPAYQVRESILFPE